MKFFHRTGGRPSRLGILPGTFNPVTVAHVALADAALSAVEEVAFVLPRMFPHKPYEGASFDERLEMLCTALAGRGRFSVAASDRGLFVEIAEECRLAYGPTPHLTFLCGRDAAERIAGWDYGRAGAFAEMLGGFDLLVAARGGEYQPPDELRPAIRTLALDGDFTDVSSREVRRRIAAGEAWEHLVPALIREQAGKIYRAR